MAKKKVTLSIDQEVWARCQVLSRTAGANWSEVAEQAFTKVADIVDELLASHPNVQSSESIQAFREDSLALLESHYQKAVEQVQDSLPVTSKVQASSK